MSDKKKTELSVIPQFVDGEQPSAAKLNSIGSLLKREGFSLEKAIGDIWGESEPYTDVSGNLLSLPIFKKDSLARIDDSQDLYGRSLDIANLGRAIGPMSKLNPKVLTEGLSEGESAVIVEEIPAGLNEYTFKHPVDFSKVYIMPPDDNAFDDKRNSLEEVNGEGKYWIDEEKNTVYTYSATEGSNIGATYRTTPRKWASGSSYNGSSYNTIPEINQLGYFDHNITQTAQGSYLFEFPDVKLIARSSSDGSLVNGSEVLNEAKYKLPPSIRAACGGEYVIENSGIVNTVIPEGILYLKNATTGEIYSDAVYRYINDSSVKVEEVELNLNDSYYFITVGTDLTSCIEDLYNKLSEHTHDGEFGEKRIAVGSIKGIYSEFMSEQKSYLPSKRKGNHFSQYLHRDGVISEDPHCDENAMRGNLLIGKESSAPGTHVGSGTSYDIRFSENSSKYSIKRVTAGDRSGIVTKASKFNNDVSKSESQLWNDGIMKLDATDRVEIFSQNGTFFDGGIINRSSGSGLASEVGAFTDPGQTWYHAKISNVTWNMRNKKVYARDYTLGSVNEEDLPRSIALNTNGMFFNKVIELPDCLGAENFTNIIGVDIVVSPGASATAWQDPNYPRNDDSKTIFGSNSMAGWDRASRQGFAWKIWQGDSTQPGYLLLTIPSNYAGLGTLAANFMGREADGSYYCFLDISVTIRYRVAE